MKVLEEFETETGITEDYDPQGDKESGYYSRAFIVEYAEWLENKLEAILNNEYIQLPKVKDITDYYCTPGDVESTGYNYISGIHACYDFVVRWNDRPIMTFEDARKKLKNVSAADHIPDYAEKMLKSFYDIIVGRE